MWDDRHLALCGIFSTAWHRRPHTPSSSITKQQVNSSAHHWDHQNTHKSRPDHRITRHIYPQRGQHALRMLWQGHGAPPGMHRQLHDQIGGEFAYRRHSLLPPHIFPMFHLSYVNANGTTKRIFPHPARPWGLTLCYLNYGPLTGLRWDKVGGLAQDWWLFVN